MVRDGRTGCGLSRFSEASTMARTVEGASFSVPVEQTAHMGTSTRERKIALAGMANEANNRVGDETLYSANRNLFGGGYRLPDAVALSNERCPGRRLVGRMWQR